MSNSAANPSSRTRPLIACLSCRRLKTKCIQSEHPPTSACARCRKKGINCEYALDPLYAYGAPAQSYQPDSSSAPQPEAGPQPAKLPYTFPPPPFRPRYSGGVPYPNLALNEDPESHPSQLECPTYEAGQSYPAYRPTQEDSQQNPAYAYPSYSAGSGQAHSGAGSSTSKYTGQYDAYSEQGYGGGYYTGYNHQ